MPGPPDSAQPLAVASADPFYASLVSPLASPPGHAPMGYGLSAGPSVRPDLRGDQLLSDIWPQPYRGPLDLDNFGRETPEMRRAFRELYAKEPAVRASIDGRAAAVAALDVSVMADDGESDADKRAAEFVDWCVERTPRGWDGLITDVFKPALIDGFAVLEVTLEEVESRKWGKKWGLRHVRSIDTAHVRLQLDQYRNVVNVVNTVRGLEYHGPRKEVVFTHGELFHNPFGMAVLRPAYRNAYLINAAYEVWSVAIKVFGAPVVTGKYKQAETRGILEKALQALRAGGYMAVPDGCEIQVLNFASATGFDAFEAHVAKCREEIYLAVRGAYLPFTQGSGGADQRGDTATHKVASDALEYLDAKAVARCLTRQLVPHLVRPNFGDEVGQPKVVLGGTNWGETKQQLEVAAQLQQMGLPLSKKQMYETGQHSPPADDGDALNPPAAGPGPGGPPGGGPGGPPGGLGQPPQLFADAAGENAALAPVGAAVLGALGMPQQFGGFDPALHPRDKGKFAPKGGGDSGKATLPESAAKHPKVVEAGKKLAAGAAGLAAKVHAAAVSAGVTPETLLGSPEDWLRIWSTHHADVVAHHLGVDALTAAQVLTHLASHAIAKVRPLLAKGVGFAGEFDPDKHPHAADGTFAPKGGGESAAPAAPAATKTKPTEPRQLPAADLSPDELRAHAERLRDAATAKIKGNGIKAFAKRENAYRIFSDGDAVKRIPPGSKFLGAGMEAIAFKSPAGTVIRVEIDRGPRPDLPEVLQPTASHVTPGGKRVEELPLARKVPADQVEGAIRQLHERLREQGYVWTDDKPANIGLVNGEVKIIDPGNIKPDPNAKKPAAAEAKPAAPEAPAPAAPAPASPPPPAPAAPKPEFHHQHTAALVRERAKKLRGAVAALGRGDIGDDEFRDAVAHWEAKTRHQIGQRYRDAHRAAADKFRADFGPEALAGPDGVRLKEAFLTAAAHAKDLASGIASAAGEHAGEEHFDTPKVRAARQEFEDRVYGAGAKLNKLHDPVYERLKAIRDRLAGDRKGEFKLGRYFYADDFAADQPRETSAHDGKRPGEFAPKGGGGGATADKGPAKSAAKPPAKAKPDAAKANTQQGAAKPAKSPAPRVPEAKPSERAARAKAAHKLIGREVQRYAEEHNEPRFAAAVGGLSWKDNEPVDVTIGPADKPRHGIEVKTLVDNGNGKITMKRSAMDLKAAWEAEHGAKFHTVVLDDQKVFNAGGPGRHDESKRRIFYRRGFGSFRVGAMHEVTGGIAELKKLMATPDDKLPPAARRSSRGA